MRRKVLVLKILLVVSILFVVVVVAASALRRQVAMGNWVFSELLGKVFVVERSGGESGVAIYLYRQRFFTLLHSTGGLGRYETTLLEWKSFVAQVNMLDQQIDQYLGLKEKE